MSDTGGLLRLKAVDNDDLQVIAGTLQDAIVPILDIAYDASERLFMFAANRFRWENTSLETGRKARRGVERVHCGVTFANVVKVQRTAIDRGRPGTFLNLLTISLVDRSDGEGQVIELTFSGDAAIRLETAALLCHLEDFGEPWPAQLQPQHAND
ncbi:MAG: DUF2948 family protein [Alphaproteobacteria bacterium]|nr:DUF2948 family protein [Alphaproteobacteria bacterium]